MDDFFTYGINFVFLCSDYVFVWTVIVMCLLWNKKEPLFECHLILVFFSSTAIQVLALQEVSAFAS